MVRCGNACGGASLADMVVLRRSGASLWAWLVPTCGALALGATFVVLGLTPPFVLVLLLVVGGVSVWAINRLHVERAEHEAMLARRDATEAVVAERLRLARDLHDIVSHGLGMITVRTAAAAHLHARHPDNDALLSALDDVEGISRSATVELRRMLDALRDDADPPVLHPTETLACLPDIIDDARRAGLRVQMYQEDLGTVSPGVQVTICRVVREGLNNTARHAGATQVDVRLWRTPSAIAVSVDDEGPERDWRAQPGAGHGLVGLQERVSSLGGVLVAGRRPDVDGPRAGFSLNATIPEAAG